MAGCNKKQKAQRSVEFITEVMQFVNAGDPQ